MTLAEELEQCELRRDTFATEDRDYLLQSNLSVIIRALKQMDHAADKKEERRAVSKSGLMDGIRRCSALAKAAQSAENLLAECRLVLLEHGVKYAETVKRIDGHLRRLAWVKRG